MILPKTYKATLEKYEKYNGMPKLSYSQYTSWKDPLYKKDYMLGYFFDIKQDSNVWADFGSDVGSFIEHYSKGLPYKPTILSQDDLSILKKLEYPDNSEYEDEIVVNMGDFVIQGFIDRSTFNKNKVSIYDYKTGNIDKKANYYASSDYGQTTLYSHQKILEGYDLEYSGVILLGRKGNGREGHPIRLSGDIKHIETPYSKERANELLNNIRKVANEISDYYKVFQKINK